MIEVEAPDGTIIEFPEGTQRDVITSVMKSKFPPEPYSPPAGAHDVSGMPDPTPEGRKGAYLAGTEALKGMPVIGALAPDNEETRAFEKKNPFATKAVQTMGGIAATMPLVAAAPGLFGMQGGGWNRLLSSALSGGGLNAADSASRGGTLDQIKEAAGTGAGLGMLPTVAGKVISPQLYSATAKRLSDLMSRSTFAAAGGVASHALGVGSGVEGAVLGLLGGEKHLSPFYKNYLTNVTMPSYRLNPAAARAAVPATDMALTEALTRAMQQPQGQQ